jgi:hypothetical protein
MAPRKKPKWGYRGRHLLTLDGIEVYSARDIEQLAKTFKIDSAQHAILKDGLESAGNIYRTYKINHDDIPGSAEVKAALDEIETLATKLKDRLKNLDDVTAWRFWRPEIEVSDLVSHSEVIRTSYGHSIERITISEGDRLVIRLEPEHLLESLEIITNYAKSAHNAVPIDKGGRPESEALRIWMINIRNLWTDHLGRRFTRAIDQGIPTSEAANFCIVAFRNIEPKAPPSRVTNAMRKVIRAENDRKGKNQVTFSVRLSHE